MQQKLESRINRIIGQLEALKKALASESYDCEQVVQQIKAIIGSTKSLGKSIIDKELDVCMKGDLSQDELKQRINKIIETAFA